MTTAPFDTPISLFGPFRAPRQMLAHQEYGGYVSLHDDATAKKLGFAAAGPIEGPTHFSQFVPLLDRLRIDDVVGAVPVHLFAGIWGTLAVAVFGEGNLLVQLTGILAVGLFVGITSSLLWFALKLTIGVRVSEEAEELGLDRTELGLDAYPEFGQGARVF